ncbi:hypothetical protein C8R43DRAFT_1135590 [Mycena crocata]|nr:hypothetical protein C8R43DRAFT_1135590 [Mycena crocata]
MPRVATPTFRARKSPIARVGKTPPCPPLRFRCTKCEWSWDRQTDNIRHGYTHLTPEEKEKLMHVCPEANCGFKALQKSNMVTHYNAKHANLKPHMCKKCKYCTADPSCLNKHMRNVHGEAAGMQKQKRKTKAEGPSAVFESTVTIPFTVTPSSQSPAQSSSSWTDAVSSPIAFSDASDSYSPAAPTLDAHFYPYGFSPSSPESSLPASPLDSWDLCFEQAVQKMSSASGAVAQKPLSPPVAQQPYVVADASGFPSMATDFALESLVFDDSLLALLQFPSSTAEADFTSYSPESFTSYSPDSAFTSCSTESAFTSSSPASALASYSPESAFASFSPITSSPQAALSPLELDLMFPVEWSPVPY